MQFNIKTSADLVKKLTNKMGLGEENHIARISLVYSLVKNCYYNPNEILKNENGKQKEYKDNTLFGNYKNYYVSLICQKYQIHKEHSDIRKYLKWHIDKGLELIDVFFEENKNTTGIEFLLDNVQLGIDAINENEVSFDFIKNKNLPSKQKGFFSKSYQNTYR